MSVEVRIICTNPDDCCIGVSRPIGAPATCSHYLECDWGRIENSGGDPLYGLQPLVLTTQSWVRKLLTEGPYSHPDRGTGSASLHGERLFIHLDHNDGRTTWELFDAHFWDGRGPGDMLIGRWPD